MPFINSKVNFPLTEDNRETLKTELGKIITLFPGKSESHLMINLDDDCKMYFAGKNDFRMAIIEVKVFGAVNESASEKVTAAITQLYSKTLDISPDKIYVKYEPCNVWGMGGYNF